MGDRGGENLRRLADYELEQSLRALLARSAVTDSEIVLHLAEIERRRLHLRAGFPSLFQYCVGSLSLSESEAYYRIGAARVAAAFPLAFQLLRERKVHLCALTMLRPFLTVDNYQELLEESQGKSKRQLQELLAKRFPACAADLQRGAAGQVEPIAEDRFRFEVSLSREAKEKLELARDLISHSNPTGDWAIVIERAVDALIEKAKKRRFALASSHDPEHAHPSKDAPKPDASSAVPASKHGEPTSTSTHAATPVTPTTGPSVHEAPQRQRVPNQVRREVALRDDLRCSFRSESGRRCNARAFLQLDHAHPVARGGPNTKENLRVYCAAHNQLMAEAEFGTRVRKRSPKQRRKAPPDQAA